MSRRLLLLLVIACHGFSQNNFSVFDQYYGDFLQSDGYEKLLSNRITYPGLFADSTKSMGTGFLGYNKSPSWNDLHGWNEWRAGDCRIGGWIGNSFLSSNDTTTSNDATTRNTDLEGTCALWFMPKSSSAFKGFSLIVAPGLQSHEQLSPSSPFPGDTWKNSVKNRSIDCKGSGILQMNKNEHVRLTVEVESSHDRGESTYYNPDTTALIVIPSDDYDRNAFSVSADIIKMKRRVISLGFECDVANRTSRYPYGNDISYSTQDHSGNASWLLAYSDYKRLQYRNYAAYLGFRASSNVRFPFQSFNHIGLKDVINLATIDNRSLLLSAQAPLLLEVHLPNTFLCIFGQYSPTFQYSISRIDGKGSDRFVLSFSAGSLGLRGRIGNNLDFAVTPSLESNIFMTGLDIRYSIPGK